MKRVAAIFGGSFDPPHIGHVLVTQYILSMHEASSEAQSGVSAVWWMPCFEHALGKKLSGFEHRLAMCELAIKGFSKRCVRVTDIEKRIESDGRTLLVLRALAKRYPTWKFKMVIGADVLDEAHKWFKFDQIESEFGLIVVPRGGKEGIINVSSTQVRSRLSRGEESEMLLTPAVASYVRKNKLY